MRESVADHSRYPSACRTLERFVGDVAAEEIFCLVESVSDAHDVAAPPLSSSTQADLAPIDNIAFGSEADMHLPIVIAALPSESGHSPDGLSCPLCANSGPPQLYSITSSARPTSGWGTLRPRALAVLRFIISSTFVDCTTGRLAGFSPLRIFPA